MARGSPPDWDAIKRDHRTGQFSLRELGRMHGVSESTIRTKRDNQKKAGNRSWDQDLAGAVRQEVGNQLARDAVAGVDGSAQYAQSSAHPRNEPSRARATEPAAAAPAPTDAAIVVAAAQRGADVVRGHRGAAARLKAQFDRVARMVDGRLERLERQEGEGLIHPMDNLFSAAELLDTLARALARLTAVERLAFNLDGKPGATPLGLEEGRSMLTAEQRSTALANLRARTAAPPTPPASQARH